MTVRLSRRALLRGAGGVAVGLPLLECMLNANGDALAATGAALPLRYVLCFGGYSLRTDAGPAAAFVPTLTGPGYDLPTCLAPLAALGLGSEVSVLSNLRLPRSPEKEVAPEAGYSEFHWHGPPLLCGTRQQGTFDASTPTPSSDQLVADAFAGQTTFDSLVYRAQALFYNLSGGVDVPDDRDTLSFRDQGSGVAPMVPTSSPQLAWQTLFTGFVPSDPADAAAAAAEIARRKSVLDVVDWRMNQLRPRLSTADQSRLDQHWDHIRTLEGRLELVEVDPVGACALLPDPGADPPLGGEFSSPTGNDVNLGYSDEDLRAEVFADLIAMALTCDRTRVVSWMITMWQSFLNAHPITGHAWNSHELHHQGTTAELEDVVTWHVEKWAGLVDRLRALPEAGGSVLDSCAVVLLNEGGTGQSTEGSHNTEQMAFLMAGGAGGLRRGEHIVLPDGTHAAQVPLTLMNAVGVPTTTLGEVSGELPQLR